MSFVCKGAGSFGCFVIGGTREKADSYSADGKIVLKN
jgi:hypothetical protein